MTDAQSPLPAATTIRPAIAVEYANGASQARTLWIGVALIAIALGFLFAGGCFLIGVLITVNIFFNIDAPPTPFLSPSSRVALMVLLFGCAAASFNAALIVFILGVRRLLTP